MSSIISNDYAILLNDIKQRIRSAQYEALKAVNKGLISLYWDIGQIIVERQEGNTWGKSVVEQLAKDLQAEFPAIRGFSTRNIWNMRNFYLSYCKSQKLQQLAAEKGCKPQPQCGTRMTRIRRIFTDTANPCASVSSVQSVFHYSFSGMKPTCMKVSAFICVYLRFLNWMIFQIGLIGLKNEAYPVNPIILSNLKCRQYAYALQQSAKVSEVG